MSESIETKTAIERVRTARHPERPYALDLFKHVFEDFVEVHGDRRYWDDAALLCGFARVDGKEVAVIGQQKGRDTNQRRHRNFGMPKPEGYRKALRLMKLAEKFGRPVISFVDTPGAYPGIDAEERGQAEAIAYNLKEMSRLKVPTIVVILGEGGSGGALAIAVGDRVLMMENAVYSVISPEGCAAILWKDAGESARAAESLKLTAVDLKRLGLIDGIIEENADWVVDDILDPETELDPTTRRLKETLVSAIAELESQTEKARQKARLEKFRNMGDWITG